MPVDDSQELTSESSNTGYLHPVVSTVTVRQLAGLLLARNFDVIDLREEREWAAGHLPRARSVTLEQIRADPDRVLPQRDGLVFICAKGVRSLQAAKLAERLGYTTIFSLEGGTNAWIEAGFQLVVESRAA